MGCFNSIFYECPACKKRTEHQSKAGTCRLEEFTPFNAPISDLADFVEHPDKCNHCGNRPTVQLQRMVHVS